ncbi:DUF4190 domain-containing protein [Actinoallomurus spadix]|uniref:DUF4190 domain-containing protein n=1 Tax=Actinoallomurus spadix TaxID=79912 RepID=A0ABP3G0X0_9ACTN|nr:DUF4190 domain-containing protein [Actinoallomurus spadix]MCO5988543.1 DUF4190 domain-containing protein [Actinoallomurus spadix]
MSDAPGPDQAGPQTQLPDPPRPPLPPTAPERGGPRARLLGIAGLVLTVLFLPAGLVLSIAALVTGVRSRKRARRVLAPAPGAVAGIVLAVISLVLALSQITLYAIAWDDLNGYVTCRESALTIDDKKTCQDEYLPRIEHRFHLPKGSLRQDPSWP